MIKNIKILMAMMLLGSTAQAAIVVTYNPPLTLGVVERYTISNSGTDVTSNYTIQSIAADPTSGYTPGKGATLFRAMQAGSFAITYVSNVDASTFTDTAVMTAAPAYVQLSSGAGQNANTGTALSQPISVLVSDASSNPISGATVTWTITGAGGTFSPSVTNSAGIASTTLTMGSTPGTYNVTATAGAISSTDAIQATSNPSANQLTNLLFQTQPASRSQKAIAFPAQPVLFLSNGSSAAYTTPTTVTASAFNNSACSSPAIGTLSGTLSVQSNASGVASFTDLVYSTNDAIFLKFTAGTLSACSNLMNIVSPTTSETKLTLNFTPTSAYVGTQFNFLVNVSDVSGNIVGSATNLVSVAPFTDASCTTAALGTLTGNTPMSAYQGQALFNSLNYSKVEGLYFLATATGLTSVCSPLVTLKANPVNTPVAIAFYYAPSSEFAGQVFSVQPFTSVKNTLASVVQINSSTITIAAYSDAACSTLAPGTLSGTKSLASIYGVGSFTNLSYSASGTIYLGISSPGLTSDCSAAVTMNATAASQAAKLKFTVQPSSSSILNTFFTTQPSVEVDDNSGAVVSGIQGFVAINWFTDSSCSVKASGLAELNTRLVNGVSAFSYLGGNTLGTYYLGATLNNLAVACSTAVIINPSSPTCTGAVHLDVASNTCQLNTQSCASIVNGTGTQTWTGSGSTYSSCAVASCNSGFYISGNTCAAQVCSPNSVAACTITNGTGSKTCSTIGDSYGSCLVATCSSGFTQQGNVCAVPPLPILTVSVSGNGSVVGTPNSGSGSIGCPVLSSCSSSFAINSTVNLVATPDYGNFFTGWDQDCASFGSSANCAIPMGNANRVTTAIFTGKFNKFKNFNNRVTAVAQQADGKIIVGGYFTSLNGVAVGQIARLYPNGTLDTTFNVGGSGFSGGYISAIAIDASGNIYVGGSFYGYNGLGSNAQGFIKLTSSGVFQKVNPGDTSGTTTNGFNGIVNAISIDPSGNVWVGGTFTSSYVGGVGVANNANRIAKLSSTGTLLKINASDVNTNIGNGFSSEVKVITMTPTSVWVGGAFNDCYSGSINSTSSSNAVAIAKLNYSGQLQKINPADANGYQSNGFAHTDVQVVNAIKIDSQGNLIIGGHMAYSFIGGIRRNINNLVKLDPTGAVVKINPSDTYAYDSGVGVSQSYMINSIAIDSSDNIYAGGDFPTSYEGNVKVLTPTGLVKFAAGTGVATAWTGSGSIVQGLSALITLSDGSLIAGSYTGLAKVVVTNLPDPTFNMGTAFNGTVYASVLQSDGKLIVGGNFTAYNTIPKGYLLRLNTDGSLDNTFIANSIGPNGIVYGLKMDSSGNTWAVGSFNQWNGVFDVADYIAKLDSTGAVLKINSADTATYQGNGCSFTIKAIDIDTSGNIWLGGNFTTCYFGGSGVANNANNIAKISPAGVRMQIAPGDVATATGNGFNAGGIVNAIKADTLGNVFVGGSFYASYIGGSGVNFNANYLVKISASGRVPVNSGDVTSATGNGFDNQVNSLLLDRSGNLYVGGAFHAAYVGGALSTATANANYIAKLSVAGALQKINSSDTSPQNGFAGYSVGPYGYVSSMALDSLNNIIIGGNFTYSYVGNASLPVNNISKISSTGIRLPINSADTATATGNGFNNIVRSILVDSSDKMIIGGDMTAYKTTLGGYLFRLNADGTDNN